MHPLFPSFVYALPKRPKPLYLRRRGEDHYVTTIDRGRVVFLGYNMTLGSTGPEARRVLRLARQRRVRRVVVDVRLNPGRRQPHLRTAAQPPSGRKQSTGPGGSSC